MPTDQLSRTFAALAHPARRAMLLRLGRGEASVQELSKPLKMSGAAITKHLKVLERSGLISRGRDAQWRPCRLRTRPMQKAGHWMEQLRAQAEGSMDRLEAYLTEIQTPTKTPRPRKPHAKGE